jgi:hypothetical protein
MPGNKTDSRETLERSFTRRQERERAYYEQKLWLAEKTHSAQIIKTNSPFNSTISMHPNN